MTWTDQAACRGLTDLFYGPNTHAAIAICAACPILERCRTETLAEEAAMELHHVVGVRGGMRQKDRARIWVDEHNGTTLRASHAMCGTDSGYYRHRRNSEPTCVECKAAHTRATADRQKRDDTPTTDTWAIGTGHKARSQKRRMWVGQVAS